MNLSKREKRQVMLWLDATRSAENADDIVMEGESGGEEENDVMEGKDEAEFKEEAGGGDEENEETEEEKQEERKEDLHPWKEGDSSQWVYRRFQEVQAMQMRHTSELVKLSETSEYDKKRWAKRDLDDSGRDNQIQALSKQFESLMMEFGNTKKWMGRIDRDRRSLEAQVWDAHNQLTAENTNIRKRLHWRGTSSAASGGWSGQWGDHSPPRDPPDGGGSI